MKKIIYLVIAAILLSSGCGRGAKKMNADVITGDLHFSFINIGGYYGIDPEEKEEFKKMIDSLKHSNKIPKEDSLAILEFQILEDEGLIERPYIEIRVDSNTLVNAYLSEADYEKVKNFNRLQLIDENKKVTLTLKGRQVTPRTFACDEILDIDKVEGKTYRRK